MDRHSHGADVLNDLFRCLLDFGQSAARFCAGTGDLMHEDRPGNAAPADGPCAVLHRYVIRGDDLLDLDALIPGKVRRHFKVHHVARVVLDDEQHALAPVRRLDGFIYLVRCGRCKDSARNGGIQHALAHITAVGRLMAAAAAADQSNFSLGTVRADDNIEAFQALQILRIRAGHPVQHFSHNIVCRIDQLLHSLMSSCSYDRWLLLKVS